MSVGGFSLETLRARAEEKRRVYPAGMVTEHLAVVEVPSETLIALVTAVEAAREAQDALGSFDLSDLDRNNAVARSLHRGLLPFDFGGSS